MYLSSTHSKKFLFRDSKVGEYGEGSGVGYGGASSGERGGRRQERIVVLVVEMVGYEGVKSAGRGDRKW
jgi:hypothetical protein